MARKTMVILSDDIVGGDADRTVKFSFDGSDYKIDLNRSNLDAFATALAPFIKAARTAGKRRTSTSSGQGRAAASKNLGEVRVWARENGFAISDRGRVSAEIMTVHQQRN